MMLFLNYKLKITIVSPDNNPEQPNVPEEILKINNIGIRELNPFDFNESLGSMYVVETLTNFYFISEKKYATQNTQSKIIIAGGDKTEGKTKNVFYKLPNEISISSTVKASNASPDDSPDSFVRNKLDRIVDTPNNYILYSNELDVAICILNTHIFPFPFPYKKKDWNEANKDEANKDEANKDEDDDNDSDDSDEDDEDGICNDTDAIINLITNNLSNDTPTEDLTLLLYKLINLLQEFYHNKEKYITEKALKEKESNGEQKMIIE